MIITKIFGTNLSLYTKLSLWLRRKPNHFKDLKRYDETKIPNSEDEGTVLSIIDITPAKLNEIVAKINSARDASTTGNIKIAIFIKTTGTQDNLVILINVI